MTPHVAVVVGSTRPGRKGEQIGRWVHRVASERDDARFELLDLTRVDLPFLDETVPPMTGRYDREHTRQWAATIDRFDGFVFVVGEYNHGVPAALKNAIDFLYAEWTNKAAGFVSYGADAGGVRSVAQLRQVLASLQVATVAASTSLRLSVDLDAEGTPHDARHAASLTSVLDQVVAWSRALASLRCPTTSTGPGG